MRLAQKKIIYDDDERSIFQTCKLYNIEDDNEIQHTYIYPPPYNIQF